MATINIYRKFHEVWTGDFEIDTQIVSQTWIYMLITILSTLHPRPCGPGEARQKSVRLFLSPQKAFIYFGLIDGKSSGEARCLRSPNAEEARASVPHRLRRLCPRQKSPLVYCVAPKGAKTKFYVI